MDENTKQRLDREWLGSHGFKRESRRQRPDGRSGWLWTRRWDGVVVTFRPHDQGWSAYVTLQHSEPDGIYEQTVRCDAFSCFPAAALKMALLGVADIGRIMRFSDLYEAIGELRTIAEE